MGGVVLVEEDVAAHLVVVADINKPAGRPVD
jgi:hypothetical protein